MEALLNATDTAKTLKVSVFTAYDLVRHKKLPAVRVGVRAYRFRRIYLERYQAENLATTVEVEPTEAGAANEGRSFRAAIPAPRRRYV